MDHEKVNDLVLHHLMVMGAYDWDQKDRGELNQVTRVIWFVTALGSHFLPRILELETKVMKHCFVD